MGTNDMAAIGGSEDAATVYADMVSLLYSASPSGYLQKGWEIYLVQNIAADDAAKMAQIPTLRGLYNDSQFQTDTDSGSGGAYEGLVSVIQSQLITLSPDGTIFNDITDAGDGTYYEDVVHLNELGTQTLITGGDTPEYGYVSIFNPAAELLASAASFSVSFGDVAFQRGLVLGASTVAYTLTGGDVTFTRGLSLA